MNERKYNINENNNCNTPDFFNDHNAEAEGVERDKRPAWLRYAAGVAAALIVTGGIAASTMKLVKNRHTVPSTMAGSDVAVSSVISSKGTKAVTTAASDTTSAATASETIAVSSEQAVQTQSSKAEPSSQTVQPSQTVQSSQAVNTAAVPAVSVQQPQSEAATVDPLYEDQCYDILNMETDYGVAIDELLQVPCSDFLDFSDTFTATARITHDTFCEGQPLLDEPMEFTVKFVHYTDPKFTSLYEMKSFVDDYYDWFRNNSYSVSNEMFGQSVVPGQIMTYDYYNPEKIYVYTIYNGKIYRGISNDLDPASLQSHADYYTSNGMALRWGHDYLSNVTANSFEDYRVQGDGDGGYYGRYKYYYYDGVNWRKDCSVERALSDAECRQIMGI